MPPTSRMARVKRLQLAIEQAADRLRATLYSTHFSPIWKATAAKSVISSHGRRHSGSNSGSRGDYARDSTLRRLAGRSNGRLCSRFALREKWKDVSLENVFRDVLRYHVGMFLQGSGKSLAHLGGHLVAHMQKLAEVRIIGLL